MKPLPFFALPAFTLYRASICRCASQENSGVVQRPHRRGGSRGYHCRLLRQGRRVLMRPLCIDSDNVTPK